QGDLEELARRVPLRYREAMARGDLFAAVAVALGPPALAWLAADDVAGGREARRRVMDRWPNDRFLLQHAFQLLSDGDADLYTGNAVHAWRRAVAAAPDFRRSQLGRNQLLRVALADLRARAALGA